MAVTSYELIKVGDSYRVTLADPAFTSGLVNNRFYLYDEAGTFVNLYPMAEIDTSGVYYYNLAIYTPGVYTIVKHALQIDYKETEVIQIVDSDMTDTAFSGPFDYLHLVLIDVIIWYVDQIYSVVNQINPIVVQIQTVTNLLKDMEVGDWKIEGSQLVFKNKDTDVEIARFNLLDELGNPVTDKALVNEVQGI
jgi:hypothetical protein